MGKILQKKLNISKSLIVRKAKTNSSNVLKSWTFWCLNGLIRSKFEGVEKRQKTFGRRITLNSRRTAAFTLIINKHNYSGKGSVNKDKNSAIDNACTDPGFRTVFFYIKKTITLNIYHIVRVESSICFDSWWIETKGQCNQQGLMKLILLPPRCLENSEALNHWLKQHIQTLKCMYR